MIRARRTRTDSCLPRRTIRCSLCPSSSVNRLALTGSAINDLTLNSGYVAIENEAGRPLTANTNRP